MGKEFEDDVRKKFPEDEYDQEADLMFEAFFSDEEEEESEITDDEVEKSYERLVQRMRINGIYEEEEEPEKASGKEEKKKYFGKFYLPQVASAACFVVICVLGVLACSMTDRANREYFASSIQNLSGEEARPVMEDIASGSQLLPEGK